MSAPKQDSHDFKTANATKEAQRLAFYTSTLKVLDDQWIERGAFKCPQNSDLTDTDSCESMASAINKFKPGCKCLETCKAYRDAKRTDKYFK